MACVLGIVRVEVWSGEPRRQSRPCAGSLATLAPRRGGPASCKPARPKARARLPVPRTFSIPRERPEGGVADPNQNPTCVFCRIIGGDETVSIIHEDEEVIAFLDVQPLHRGHVLVVPKAHYKNLFYVPESWRRAPSPWPSASFRAAARHGVPGGQPLSPPTARMAGRTSSTSTCT
jgi:hypothetical protein